MRATYTDKIETTITLDTVDIKSICDTIAEENPHRDKDDFFDIAMGEVIHDYFDGYIWYRDDMPIYEVEEMCPTIVEKIAEYIDWYIIHYYLTEQEDFKWSD